MDNERLIGEVKQNIEKNNSRNKKRIVIIGTVFILLAAAGIIFLNSSNSCGSAFCSLTGNVVSVDSSPIVAEFNGGKITSNELDKNYNLYSSNYPKKNILNQTISQKVLYLEAVKKGYQTTNEKVEEDLNDSLAKAGQTLDSFKERLNNKNISYDFYINYYKEKLTIILFLNDTVFKNLEISDKDAQDYYSKNTSAYNVPEQISASHILVNSSEQAKEIIKELDNGADFAELAKKYSIGPSAPNGGDLGYFSKGQMVPEFENAAFSLKNILDYTREPVKTQFGYHIIMLTDKKPARTLDFEEAKDSIKKYLFANKENELTKNYLDELLKNANVKIYEENIN